MKRSIYAVMFSLLTQWSFLGKLFTKKGRDELKVEDMNEKLKTAILEQAQQKRKLRRKILNEYNSKKTGISRYIPLHVTSNAKIKQEVLAKYGEEMKSVGLEINKDLTFK